LEFLYEYGLFLAQAITLVAAVLIVVGGIVAITSRQRSEQQEGHIEIRHLNEKYRHIGATIKSVVDDPMATKELAKSEKKAEKAKAKDAKKKRKKAGSAEQEGGQPRLYVLNFDGDIRASATENLREEITAVLPQIQDGDEILVRLESPGGMVHGYGLAASQLQRIRSAGVPLTAAVDTVAASGGYLMAAIADRFIAAPFAIIGSIGVINASFGFTEAMEKLGVERRVKTAGKSKLMADPFSLGRFTEGRMIDESVAAAVAH